MLDSIFLVLFIGSFLLTVLGEREDSVGYNMMALVIWVVLFVQSLWIQDVAGNVYNEFGLSAICLGFVFVNLFFVLDYFFDFRKARQGPARPPF